MFCMREILFACRKYTVAKNDDKSVTFRARPNKNNDIESFTFTTNDKKRALFLTVGQGDCVRLTDSELEIVLEDGNRKKKCAKKKGNRF